MRKYAFIAALFVASVFATEASAQCSGTFDVDNGTNDTWTLSIHNLDYVIAPNSSQTINYIGGNEKASVGAIYSVSPLCGSKFLQIIEVIPTPCAPNTAGIFYIKNNVDINGCVTDADVAFF